MKPIEGGYDKLLVGWDPARSGFPVRVVELDTGDAATAHVIMADIMAGKQSGVLTADVRYTGKHPERWLQHVAPSVLHPQHFGLLSPTGELLGWLSLMDTFTRADVAQFGLIIKPGWKGKGLGSATLGHVLQEKDLMRNKPVLILIIVTTCTNKAMTRIVEKSGAFVYNGILIDGGVRKASYSTSPSPLFKFRASDGSN